jgi:hypothetical protein
MVRSVEFLYKLFKDLIGPPSLRRVKATLRRSVSMLNTGATWLGQMRMASSSATLRVRPIRQQQNAL